MPLSQEEVIGIKSDIQIMKNSISEMSDAQKENTQAQTKVVEQISALLIEMKERDVRDEYLEKQVNINKENHDKFVEFAAPTIRRSASIHNKLDKFWDGMTSNWGKLFSITIILGIMYALGLNPSDLVK